MKKFLLGNLLCLLASPAWALVGGPFDNDSALPTGGEGTYQGIATGTESNLIGIVQFAWSSATGSTGLAVFWNEGVQQVGDLQAVVNIPGRTLAGVTTAIIDDFSASFTARLSGVNSPILTFDGTGFYSGPESLLRTSTTTDVVTETTIETITQGNVTGEIATESTTTDDYSITETDYVPFTISGIRTSVRVGSFTGDPTNTTPDTGN